MIKIFINASIVIFLVLHSVSKTGFAQQVLLYQNNFETPLISPEVNCGPDIDQTSANLLWGGTGMGIGGGGHFEQEFTIETILINGPMEQYTDTSGLGGNYCLGMLSAIQNDKVALTLNGQMLHYLNISFLISPIDMTFDCGGPFGVDTAKMKLTVYDTPGGKFSFSSPGTLLDEDLITARLPGITSYTFNWFYCSISLDISNSVDSNITIVFDLIQSGYAAIDCIEITSSSAPSFIHSLNENINIIVFPNPFSTEIEISGTSSTGSLILIDATGKEIFHHKTLSNRTKMNTENLLPGLYFLSYYEKHKISHFKLIKI